MAPASQNCPATESTQALRELADEDPNEDFEQDSTGVDLSAVAKDADDDLEDDDIDEDDDLVEEDPDDFEDDTEEDEEDEEDDLEDEDDEDEEAAPLRAAAGDQGDDDSNDDGRENAVDEDDLNAEAEDDLDGSDDPSLDPVEAETIRRRLEVAIVPLAEVPPPANAATI